MISVRSRCARKTGQTVHDDAVAYRTRLLLTAAFFVIVGSAALRALVWLLGS